MGKAKFDVYAHVTDAIIAEIEAGTPPWQKPWTGGAGGTCLPVRWNGEAYRGINVLMLWATAAAKGYGSERWMTYKQAAELGGQVRKGEKSATVVKYGTIERENDAGEEQRVAYARAYRVFNADQIDGLPEDFYIQPDPPRDLGTESDPELEAFFAATGATIITSDEPRAYYRPSTDTVHMPPTRTFHDASRYFGVLGHEVSHWTGSPKRLDRLARFASKSEYAFEELCAELGASMVSARLGVTPSFEQSAAYIESWLSVLREDSRAIFRAASEAQKAADYIFDQVAANSASKQAEPA